MVNLDRMTKELLECIRIPSPSLQEKRFAARVRAALVGLGIKCQEDDAAKKIGGDCGNLLARVPGKRSLPTLLLCAHLDTVETGEGISPRIVNGVVRASANTVLGADDKAGVVAILETLRLLKEQKIPHGPLEIVFTVAEEKGLLGARNFDWSRLQAQAAFVLDSAAPVGGIIARAPAYDALDITVTGRAAHAGANPQNGVSAIQIAAAAVAKMRLGRVDEKTTANIGLISGGAARNVVPDRCTLKGEARSHSPAALRRQVQHMLRCLHQAAAQAGGGIEVEIERQFEAFRAPMNSLPVRLAKAAAGRLGLPFHAGVSGGGADTAIIAAAGIPAVTINTGFENPHSPQECISLEQLRRLGEYTLALVQISDRRFEISDAR